MTQGEESALAAIRARMQSWRTAHPRATLTEIEQELDRQLATVRAQWLTELAGTSPADMGVCPDCGGALVRRGERARSLRTTGDQDIVLRRPYATCSRCGRGLFPPG
jgi:hypothetical protein